MIFCPAVLSPDETARMIYGGCCTAGRAENNVFTGPSRHRQNWVTCKMQRLCLRLTNLIMVILPCMLFFIWLDYRGFSSLIVSLWQTHVVLVKSLQHSPGVSVGSRKNSDYILKQTPHQVLRILFRKKQISLHILLQECQHN